VHEVGRISTGGPGKVIGVVLDERPAQVDHRQLVVQARCREQPAGRGDLDGRAFLCPPHPERRTDYAGAAMIAQC